MIYADVVLDGTSFNIDRLFTYRVKPSHCPKILIGQKVLVPFGLQDEWVEAIVVSLNQKCELDPSKIKDIEVLIDGPVLTIELIELGFWIRDSFYCTYADAFKLIYPTGVSASADKLVALKTLEKKENESLKNNIFQYLSEKKEARLSELNRIFTKKEMNHFLREEAYLDLLEIKDLYHVTRNIQYTSFIKAIQGEALVNTYQVLRKSTKQLELYKYLEDKEWIDSKSLNERGYSNAIIKGLLEKGLIEVEKKAKNRFLNPYDSSEKKYELTALQQKAFETMMASDKRVQLLFGITGSGKTVLYIEWIKKMLSENKSTILLVPEISLTPQTIRVFTEVFGERVAVLHSRLSIGERFDEWRRIDSSEANIVIGARSAIFAPCKNLGLVIIDEEHENSYKSGSNPRYDTIEVATRRCELADAKLLLGSATPSLESYHKGVEGLYELVTLQQRVNDFALPEVKVVDLKKELEKGNKSFISHQLYQAIKENLNQKEQTIIFINRRGYSNSVSCRKCGYVMGCDDCEIAMTYHLTTKRVHCHYCGKTKAIPATCPACGSPYFKTFGLGTQQVEGYLQKLFPKAKIARMDADTTQKKGSHEKILDGFRAADYDILVGTQMITKGLDIHNVTLVGILAAELSLNIPDFRAPEKTFQLLTQVSGRAGRGEKPGRVLLQTYNPEHYAIQLAQLQDYQSFYKQEIAIRKAFLYPPFVTMILIQISGETESAVEEVCNALKEVYEKTDFDYLGPNPSPIAKIQKKYRWQIVFKLSKMDLDTFKKIYENDVLKIKQMGKRKGISIVVDVDPSTIL